MVSHRFWSGSPPVFIDTVPSPLSVREPLVTFTWKGKVSGSPSSSMMFITPLFSRLLPLPFLAKQIEVNSIIIIPEINSVLYRLKLICYH